MVEERNFSESDLCAFIMGEGSPAQRRAIQEAIASSPELSRTYHSLLKTWDLLDRYQVPQPPTGGLEDLHRRLKVQALLGRRTGVASTLPSWRVAAIAAVLVLAVGIPVVMFNGGTGNPEIDVVRVATPMIPEAVATPVALPARAEFASIPARPVPSRRFLFGSDGNLWAGATIVVDSLADWESPVLSVDHMDDLPDLRFEDYVINNHDFDGGYHFPAQPEAVPVSLDPM
jgi:hypothetical protein